MQLYYFWCRFTLPLSGLDILQVMFWTQGSVLPHLLSLGHILGHNMTSLPLQDPYDSWCQGDDGKLYHTYAMQHFDQNWSLILQLPHLGNMPMSFNMFTPVT